MHDDSQEEGRRRRDREEGEGEKDPFMMVSLGIHILYIKKGLPSAT